MGRCLHHAKRAEWNQAASLSFSPINRTLRDVFPTVLAYNQAVYSFLDEWGWNLAIAEKDANTKLSVEKVDQLIADRINGELKFLDGVSWQGIFALSKGHRKTLEAETCVMSVAGNTHRFMCNPGTVTIGAAAQAAAKSGGY